jgi:hypothetical protein
MSKKVLSLVLALVMVLGSFSFVSAVKYDDVTGTTYAEAVDRLSLLGILEGYPDGTFKPDGEITRAEFAAVAIRAKGLKATAEAAQGLPTGFTDVPGTFWASGIIGTAGKLGIVNGVGNGLFAPQAPVKYEEAITMLVRALGYEPSAQAKGGYPYGYLIVANEVGLLDAVKGTQGAPATRGSVAQMTDNALEIEMMVQVGYGTDTKWVVSGTEDTTEKYLLDELGFDSVIGRPTSVNSNRKGITVSVEDEDEIKRLGKNKVSVTLPEGFDVYAIEGLESKIWYRDDIVIAKALEEAKYDAFEYNEDDEELELITEDEAYEIAASKDLYDITIDDDKFKDLKDGAVADYAKVVLNDDDEIIWAQGYTFDGFIVVDEVKDEVVYSADDYDDVDVEDFLFVKDGKEIKSADLEEGDVLYYNADEEFAVVYNNSKTGEIERVYADDKQDIRFAGSNYTIADDAIYVSENGKIGELSSVNLEEIADNDEEVTIFFNYHDEVTVVMGEPDTGTSAYYALRENANVYGGRKGDMLALDLRDSTGAKVSFDLDTDFIGEDEDFLIQDGDGGFDVNKDDIDKLAAKLTEGHVLKVTLDKDGDPKEVALMTEFKVRDNDDIEIDDSKVRSDDGTDFKLQSSTVVFYDDLKEAITLGNAKDEFSKVKNVKFFVEKGKVVAIVGETDADSDTTMVSGLLVKKSDISKLKNDKYEIKIKVSGSTKRYVTEDDDLTSSDFKKFKDGSIVNLEIGDKSGEVKDFDLAKPLTIKVDDVRGKTIKADNGKEYTLNNDGIVYEFENNKYEEIRLSEVDGKTVTIYFEGNSSRFVNYVILGDVNAGDELTGVITNINTNSGEESFTVDGKTSYFLNTKVVLEKDGKVIATGISQVVKALKLDDQVDVKVNSDGEAVRIEIITTADDRTEEEKLEAATAAVEKAEESKLQADVDAAQKLVDKLAKGTAKTELQERLDKIEVSQTELEAATAAVVKAEKSKLQADVDAAQKLVDKLPAGAEKVALNKRLMDIETEDPATVTGVEASGKVTVEGADNITSSAAVKAEVTVDTDIVITAKTAGKAGNDITVELVQGEGDKVALAVEVTGNGIKVILSTDAAGNADATKADVVDAINADADAKELVVASGGSSEDIAEAASRVALKGGKDAVEAKDAVKEEYTLTITNGATATGTIEVFDGTTSLGTVPVIDGMTAEMVAEKIEDSALTVSGYTITVNGNKVIFTADTAGAKSTSLNITVVDK